MLMAIILWSLNIFQMTEKRLTDEWASTGFHPEWFFIQYINFNHILKILSW